MSDVPGKGDQADAAVELAATAARKRTCDDPRAYRSRWVGPSPGPSPLRFGKDPHLLVHPVTVSRWP
jgi:hypothetical protein